MYASGFKIVTLYFEYDSMSAVMNDRPLGASEGDSKSLRYGYT